MYGVLQTERLLLRRLTEDDWEDLCEILQDAETMYAYEHAFSEREARASRIS
ncbi:MAG: GNAT family N-acetyltransferase [Oscillospiraceae bacterium]